MNTLSNNSIYNEILGQNIRDIRKNINITQEELAEKLNMNSKSISKIENGKVGISLDTAINICQLANCSSVHLFKNIIKSPDISDKYELLSQRDKSVINQMITYLLNTK